MKRLAIIFFLAFLTNIVWENLHSFLYESYMGHKITQIILLRASLWDAVIITLISIPFLYLSFFKNKNWMIIFIGFIIALSIEWYALDTGRCIYKAYMPIIPILNVGLTPIVQLALLSYISYRLQAYVYRRNN